MRRQYTPTRGDVQYAWWFADILNGSSMTAVARNAGVTKQAVSQGINRFLKRAPRFNLRRRP